MFKFSTQTLLAALLITSLPNAHANNGLYLTGYGAESVFMGGADVAVARDAFAAGNNPSGMTQLSKQALDVMASIYYAYDETHTDSYGNYRKPFKNSIGGYASGAYARPLDDPALAAGASLTVQGGLGWVYSGLNTVFGTRDDASALFTVIKLAPALAWKVNDQLSVGAALGINYVAAAQELFPNTSVPSPAPGVPAFVGFRFKDAGGFALNTKWGMQYRPFDDVMIGVTYGTRTGDVPIKGGNLRANYSNIIPGQGVVRYDNAKLSGLHLPEEFAIGISFRPASRWLVSMQDKWYHWSDAIKTLHITATDPRGVGAPATFSLSAPADFRDQHVLALGLAYDYDIDTLLMIGANHGKKPLPDQNFSPIFATYQSLHYMLGATRNIDREWKISGGIERYVFKSVTYDSQLFGPRANERGSNYVFQVGVSRRWQ